MARFAYVPIAAAALLLWPGFVFAASEGAVDGRWKGDALMGGDINECDGITSLDLDFNVSGPNIDGRFKAGHYGWINIDGSVDASGLIDMKSSFADFRGTLDAKSGTGKGKFGTAFGCGGLFDLKLSRQQLASVANFGCPTWSFCENIIQQKDILTPGCTDSLGVIMYLSRPLIAAFLPVFLANCASIVSDDDSNTYIETVPEVARCELHGQDFVRVVNTPASLQLPAKAAPIVLSCKADGYRTTTADMDTAMDGWILGNILLGGIVGIAIDAARGAGQKYPPKVTVVLEPSEFSDLAARDAWYDDRRNSLIKKWDTAMLTVRTQCNQVEGGKDCPAEMEKVEAARQVELDKLEARRAGAQVRLR